MPLVKDKFLSSPKNGAYVSEELIKPISNIGYILLRRKAGAIIEWSALNTGKLSTENQQTVRLNSL